MAAALRAGYSSSRVPMKMIRDSRRELLLKLFHISYDHFVIICGLCCE